MRGLFGDSLARLPPRLGCEALVFSEETQVIPVNEVPDLLFRYGIHMRNEVKTIHGKTLRDAGRSAYGYTEYFYCLSFPSAITFAAFQFYSSVSTLVPRHMHIIQIILGSLCEMVRCREKQQARNCNVLVVHPFWMRFGKFFMQKSSIPIPLRTLHSRLDSDVDNLQKNSSSKGLPLVLGNQASYNMPYWTLGYRYLLHRFSILLNIRVG
ncbi:hypothetical protein BD410DRAFT_281587 [Rickenella mellea]|uniref:Uncharacterized protein n=1 Tax=Rickenella mellea TaxID=50990 RepID=A0A4Y7Q3N4_9AGAM|nr:hypothetical protein BD410DRAFT_281587 [Rickenella mellea]